MILLAKHSFIHLNNLDHVDYECLPIFDLQIGRLVYELMQANGDRTFDSTTIDFAFHYWGSYSRAHEAIKNHDPLDGEIELRVGDRLRIRAEKYTPYMGFAENMRTNKHGVYPMSKVKPIIVQALYPGLG